jgi:poly(A) polymerase
MREIWSMQPRFEKRVGSAPYSLLEQPRFRAGFDFLRLRGQTGEIDKALSEWWEKFSTAYDDERHEMIEAVRKEQAAKPQAPRVRVRRTDAAASPAFTEDAALSGRQADDGADTVADGQAGDDSLSAAPRKRRRRRKPTGAAGDAGTSVVAPSGD